MSIGLSQPFGASIDSAEITDGTVTDTDLASPNNVTYKTVFRTPVAKFPASTAVGTFYITDAGGIVGAANAAAGQAVHYFDPADYAVAGKTTKLRLRMVTATNDVAPTCSFAGLVAPITAVAGASGTNNTITVGASTATTATITTPAADGISSAVVSSDTTWSTAGLYVIGFTTTTATSAVGSSTEVYLDLSVRTTQLELHDTFAGKGTKALDQTKADTGQTWQSSFTSIAGHGLSLISNKLTMTPTTRGAGYSQGRLNGNVVSMGAKFTFDAASGTTQGTVVLLCLQQQLTAIDSTLKAAAHLAIRPTGWIFSIITGGSTIDLQTGGYQQNITDDGATVYQASWKLGDGQAFLSLPDGTSQTITDSRISPLRGNWAIFEVIINNDNTDAKGRFTEVWADSEYNAGSIGRSARISL